MESRSPIRVIDALPQFLAGLEVWLVFRWNLDRLSGLRIPALPGWSIAQGETSDPPDFDAITAN
jgi:hypothetical protein